MAMRALFGFLFAAAGLLLLIPLDPAARPLAFLAALLLAAAGIAFPRDPEPDDAAPPRDLPVAEAPLADAVMDAIDDPILIVEDGRVARANHAALRLFGEHLVDDDYRVALRHPSAADALARARPGVPGRATLTGIGGDERRFEMQATWITETGRIVRLVDRTTAAAVEQARTDFVANASHELRTPLSTLIGFIETLEDRNAATHAATRTRFLGIMMKEARRMQQLVDDLISLSRIETERFSAPAAPVVLDGLLGEVRDSILTAGRLPPGRVVLDLPAEPVTIAGDRGQLGQLLHNLIGNALKYGRPETAVRVGLSREHGRVALAVQDEGEGISPEHLPRITERFYRVDPGRSRALGGTGLGLAIVKHIVERHRGRMSIDSKQGVGTTVTVRLPLLDEGDPPEPPAKPPVA